MMKEAPRARLFTSLALLLPYAASALEHFSLSIPQSASATCIRALNSSDEGEKILKIFKSYSTLPESARNQKVLTDQLLENGTYGEFRVLCDRFQAPATNYLQKGELQRQIQLLLTAHFTEWFPATLFQDGLPEAVFVGGNGIEGFTFSSLKSLRGFFANGGAEVFTTWGLSRLTLRNQIERVDENHHKEYRQIAQLKTLRTLELALQIGDQDLHAVASSPSIRRLILQQEATQHLPELNALVSMKGLSHLNLHIGYVVDFDVDFRGEVEAWDDEVFWSEALSSLHSQRIQDPLNMIVELHETSPFDIGISGAAYRLRRHLETLGPTQVSTREDHWD